MKDIDLSGKTLDDRYKVEEELGAGGMATVYLARDERLGRKVVVKIPHPFLLKDEKFLERFSREIRALVDLTHPHIVKVHDTGTYEDVPYAVMEFLEGNSLKERLDDKGGRESSEDILTWLKPIALALDHMHEEGVIHRDVKPGNILFDGKGNSCLSDFGIAKALERTEPELTLTGQSPGSPGYMPPEILSGKLGAGYDQYALAAVVYRAVVGEAPELFQAHKGVGNAVAGRLPIPAARVLEKAFSVEPENRYPSCAAFAKAFEESLEEESPFVEGDDDTGTWMLDSRTMPEGMPTGTLVQDGEKEQPTTMVKRRSKALLLVPLILVLAGGGAAYFYLFARSPALEGTSEALEQARAHVQQREYGKAVAVLQQFIAENQGAGEELEPIKGELRAISKEREKVHREALDEGLRLLGTAKTPEQCDAALEKLEEAERILPAEESAKAVERAQQMKAGFGASRETGLGAIERARSAEKLGDIEEAARQYRVAEKDLAAVGEDGPAKAKAEELEGRVAKFNAAMAKAAEAASAKGRGEEALAALTEAKEAWPLGYERADGDALRKKVEEGGKAELYATHLAAARKAEMEERWKEAEEAFAKALESKETPEAKEGQERCGNRRLYEEKMAEAGQLLAKSEWDAAASAFTEAETRAVTAGVSPEDARRGRARAEGGKKADARYPEETRTRFAKLIASEGWKAADPVATPEGILEAVHEDTELVFVLVPGGEFERGGKVERDEQPVRTVRVPPFLLAKTECTQAAWKRAGPPDESFFEGDSLPVERVTWLEARAWCDMAKLRLPSEAEWEYACRAGTKSVYFTGDVAATLKGHANVADAYLAANLDKVPKRDGGYKSARDVNDGHAATAPVGSFRANAWGLLDMHGNVWEWCEDRYHGNYDDAPLDGSPWTEGESDFRILRGGSWSENPDAARAGNRSSDGTEKRFADTGFRPAADLP
jgi:formylglycine-generating enzyme required for sulfatase activity/tRNA A-37 threonylcarbamoyl transferase component Bud32